ncbi:MAG TPA: M24 family metallopeptidase [Chloroflexota bacterium]|nr:M24 family metallopeptidase [Chloroflexota bacterium]
MTQVADTGVMHPYRRFSLAERDRRWAALRRLMDRDRLDAIVAPPNNGNSTDWQADARYISHCGGGADASIGVVFPREGEVTVVATSAQDRWGPKIQNWVADVREVNRRYGRGMAERLLELGLQRGRIGICGLDFGTRTPEGLILHGTYLALREALPDAEFVSASDLLQEVREVKSQEEIDVLQRSVDLIERALEAQALWAQPGVPDYVVWAETMHAMFVRGSEPTVHFNWISGRNPVRTLTRPTARPLEKGDLILKEIESSIIGYRAQQLRPLAVHECDPIIIDLAKLHADLYDEVLAFLKPGVTVGELVLKTREVAARLAPKRGPLAGATAGMLLHGRGLGDDRPLIIPSGYEGTDRAWSQPFPENGVYICKPGVQTADDRYRFEWGDTIRTTATGAVRMGRAPHGVIISEPREVSWPTD